VRAVASGPFAAGRHAFSWDGHDENGADAAPGIYFARVRAGTFQDTKRLVRLH
jgi:hypothetical protein